MRRSAFGISVALGMLLGCDGGDKTVPAKPSVRDPQRAEPGARPRGESAASSAPPVVKVMRPQDGEPGPEGEALESLVAAEPGQAYGQVLLHTRSGENHIAELTIVRAEGVKARGGSLRYTAEPRIVVAKAKLKVDEANLLGTGISLDIDGDGKTTSKIRTRCEDGTVVLETPSPLRLESVTELSEAVARFDYGTGDARLLANDGAGAVLYAPCDKGTLILGLNPSAPLTMHEVPSPAVFVVYRVEVESAAAEDPFSLQKVDAGEKAVEHELYSFREFSVEGDTVKVYAAHLVVFALDPAIALQHISLEIAGDTPEFVTASINEVDGGGHRIRYADGFKPF
ncbi:MAG: hypothetical protein KUG77_05855 [Nannocystaceae bacterium]|nr:hypothetical protein [Nannocystaceae bacterium]